MTSLRASLSQIGVAMNAPVAVCGSFGNRTPHSMRVALTGMTDPKVGQWKHVGVALLSENTELAKEAQGVTTDGGLWYVCSNNTKSVVAFDDDANRVATFTPHSVSVLRMWQDAGRPFAIEGPDGIPVMGDFSVPVEGPNGFPVMAENWNPHFGAPSFDDGWIRVPIQNPRGVWRFRTDGSAQTWQKAQKLPDDEDDLWAWCAVHPVNGLLYTCNSSSTRPRRVRAYDPITLVRFPEHDIPLGKAPLDLHRVQGGTFTRHGRLILVRWSFNAVFIYSSLNGFCFGARKLGDFGSTGSEVESVTIRTWKHDGTLAPVHIMELDNDAATEGTDDFYLHSYSVPNPAAL